MIKWRTCYAGLCGISSCPYKIRKTFGIRKKHKELLKRCLGTQWKQIELLKTSSSSQIGVEPMRDRSRPMRDSMLGGARKSLRGSTPGEGRSRPMRDHSRPMRDSMSGAS